MFKGIPVGHIAIIKEVTFEDNKIKSLLIYHSKGSAGPVKQKVNLDDKDDSYYKFVSTFNYWKWE